MEVSEMLEMADLYEYASQYIDLQLISGEYWGLSPFKDENTPSFSINPDKNVFFDFSSGKSGNIITFISEYHHCSIPEAIEKLKEFLNISDSVTYTPPPPIIKELKKYKPKAKKELAQHKILNSDTLNKYRDERIELWEEEGILYETCQKFNIKVDPYFLSIIIPIYDNNGNLINLCRRTMNPDFKSLGIPKYIYRYPLGCLDFFYAYSINKESIQKKKQIILVEGAKSVMKLYQWGYDNAVAVLTSHLNEMQMACLIKWGYDVVVCFDKDAHPREDPNIRRLSRFVKVEIATDFWKLLKEKDSPCDRGLETWQKIFEGRRRFKWVL